MEDIDDKITDESNQWPEAGYVLPSAFAISSTPATGTESRYAGTGKP
jgi:hypothetical protein